MCPADVLRQAVLEAMPQLSAKLHSLAGRLGLLVLCLGILPAPARCQTGAPDHYFNQRTFDIPFEWDNSRSLRQFFLYASTDGKNYTKVAAAAPNSADKFFTYTAAGDGMYYFVVQVEDLENRLTPANVNLAPAGLRVCVDTTKPTAILKPVAPQAPYTVAVEWEVSDVNIDLRTLKLKYAAVGSDRWTVLEAAQLAHAQFSWTPVGAGPFNVQAEVSDKAGNTATATARVAPGTAAAPGTGTATAPANSQRVIHVRSKTFKLNYKCDNKGPSGVQRVEIWMTRDTSQWTKFKTDAPVEGPCELKVPTSGRYGFTLCPINGVGRGPDPPVIRQLPQLWIEVDESAPQVSIHSVVVGDGKDTGFFTVNWLATDKWLRARPITISWAKSLDGPWNVIQSDLENTGTARLPWNKDTNEYEFYLQVKAIDEAGNEGHAETREKVKVDTQIPKVIDIGVMGVEGAKPAN
jgi:hypothetical protein